MQLMIQTLFPNSDAVSQADNALIHTAQNVHSCFEESEGKLQHFRWPAQSPDLNIIEPLWSVLETRVGKKFPTPTSLKNLKKLFKKNNI
jgi:transposase